MRVVRKRLAEEIHVPDMLLRGTLEGLLSDMVIGHSIDLTQYSNDVVRRALAILKGADFEMLVSLQGSLEGLPTSVSVGRLEAALSDAKVINTAAVTRLDREILSMEMRELVELEARFYYDMTRKAVPGWNPLRVDDQAAYTAARARPFQGRLLSEWSKSIETGRMSRIRDSLRMGYVEGKTVDQMVRALRGTKAAGYADGLLAIETRNAEAVVRTAIQHMAAFTRERFYEVNEALLAGKRWVSTLDSRTTPQCFPASTTALAIGDASGMAARFYEGDLVVITTAAGKQLRATPNHPVLTARGWRAMQEVSPGNDVLYRVDSDVGCVCSGVNVGVPPTFGAIADALFQPSAVDVFCERSSEADFHGDGMTGDQQVQIALFDGNLRATLKASGKEQIADALFVGVEVAGEFSSDGRRHLHTLGMGPATEPPQWEAGSLDHGKQPAAADVEALHDLRWAHAIAERGKNASTVAPPVAAPREVRHDTSTFEHSRHRCSGDFVVPCNRCGRLSLRVSADDVVSVRREPFAGHVFNLQTSSESYIAGSGFVVRNCQIRDGLEYTTDNKPAGHKVPWLAGPGQLHWNCVSGDAAIRSPGRVRAIYRRAHEGELFTIKTENGRSITVTANHPILTPSGWQSASSLGVGEEVICEHAAGDSAPDGSPQNDGMQPSAGELCKAATELCGVLPVEVPMSGPDFHGDGANSEVCEVWADGALGDELDAVFPKLGGQFNFEPPDLDGSDTLARLRRLNEGLASNNSPASRRIGRPSVGSLTSSPSGAKVFAASSCDASGDAPSTQGSEGAPELGRDVPGSYSVFDVETDRIVSIRVLRHGMVPVFNFETDSGWYVAGGIVCHNCRSTSIPIIKDFEKLGLRQREGTRASQGGPVPRGTTYLEWLKSQSAERQDQVLGPTRGEMFRAGGITLDRFWNDKGIFLTLDELRSRNSATVQ